jgi:hypothetical protein
MNPATRKAAQHRVVGVGGRRNDLGFGRETGHERGGGVAGIVLLDETDGGIDDKQGDDADEVLPVRRLILIDGKIRQEEQNKTNVTLSNLEL